MVALLAVEGNLTATIQLEQLWNDLQQAEPFALFCAYPMNQLGGEALAALLREVCNEHSHVIPAESYTALPTADERLRAIAALQQKARWLEAEVVERRRAEEQLRDALLAERYARQQAEAALHMRDDFLALAAHELKTPITGLAGYANLLHRQLKRDGRLEPARVAQALEMISSQSNKLSRLLNQLLDISRLEAGKLPLDLRSTDLVALAQQVVAGVQATTEQHTICLQSPPSLAALVDPLRLEQVLANLLDNAVKYSPDGSTIDITISEPLPGAIELAVRDRGPGIPPDKRAQIFERFYQAHGNGNKSGLGLGLFISREIAELHGGTIRAEFPPDGGSCFIVRLPVTLDMPSTVAADG